MATITDEEIKASWLYIQRGYYGRSSLGKKLAMLELELLEKAGVTEEDIDRLFPITPIEVWLRDNFVDPSMS